MLYVCRFTDPKYNVEHIMTQLRQWLSMRTLSCGECVCVLLKSESVEMINAIEKVYFHSLLHKCDYSLCYYCARLSLVMCLVLCGWSLLKWYSSIESSWQLKNFVNKIENLFHRQSSHHTIWNHTRTPFRCTWAMAQLKHLFT